MAGVAGRQVEDRAQLLVGAVVLFPGVITSYSIHYTKLYDAVAQDGDLFRIFDGAQAVGDDKGDPPVTEPFEGFLDQGFALVIQCAGGFVENEQLGVFA